jgi:NADP-dependent 3-hydroxy acid dehydrogenase YdfG
MAVTDLENKVALVTGATSGIGEATARAFARGGARVVVSGRSRERGEAVCGAIQQTGGEACFVCADVTDADQVEALVRQYSAMAASTVPSTMPALP